MTVRAFGATVEAYAFLRLLARCVIRRPSVGQHVALLRQRTTPSRCRCNTSAAAVRHYKFTRIYGVSSAATYAFGNRPTSAKLDLS